MSFIDRPRAERILTAQGLDALILLSPESFRYATGAEPGVATMWRQAGAVAVLVPCDASLPEMAVASDLFAAAFRYSSLAALLSVVIAAIAAWFLTDPRAAMLLTLLVPLVWVRHHENIARLLNGTESKIGGGKKQAA